MNYFSVFLVSFLIFLASFCVQIMIWKTFKPVKQMLWLFGLFFIFVPFAGSLFLFALESHLALNFEISLLSVLFYYLIAAAYVQTFPAIQADCPTLKLIHIIGSSKTGVSFDDLKKVFSRKELVDSRLDDLINEGFVKIFGHSDRSIVPTKKGALLANIFSFYRKLLGLEEGQG